MVFDEPVQKNAGLDLYKKPEKEEHILLFVMLQEEQNKTTLHLLYLMYQNYLIVLLQNIVITKSNLYCFQM